jgi:hypothetical protein
MAYVLDSISLGEIRWDESLVLDLALRVAHMNSGQCPLGKAVGHIIASGSNRVLGRQLTTSAVGWHGMLDNA